MKNMKLSSPLDKYIIHSVIGTGAFANVCEASDKQKPGCKLAIKIMLDKEDKNYMNYAAQEIAALKLLKHPNIIDIIEYCFTKESIAFVMPRMEFGNLKDHIKICGNMIKEESKVKSIMQQLCDALYYMHSISVMHGDIKTSNILIESQSQSRMFTRNCFMKIKLCDFGLTTVITEEVCDNHLTGSLDYMAPEKLLKQPFNCISDLYSAGVVMYECIFAKVPFQGSLQYHTTIVKNSTPIDYPAAFKSLSPDVQDLLKGLLKFDKSLRLKGDDLIHHPFLKIQPKSYKSNNYLYAKRIIDSTHELEENKDFGRSYVAYREAVVNLQVYSVTCDNPNLITYLHAKIDEYRKWSKHLETAIISQELPNKLVDLFNYDSEYKQLRQVCLSTQELAIGLDLVYMGDMYYKEKQFGLAQNYLMEGIGKLLSALEKEPPGLRKNILGGKIQDWIHLLEMVKQITGNKDGETETSDHVAKHEH